MLAFTLPSLYSYILLNEKATEGEEQEEEEEDDEDMDTIRSKRKGVKRVIEEDDQERYLGLAYTHRYNSIIVTLYTGRMRQRASSALLPPKRRRLGGRESTLQRRLRPSISSSM
jgi:hypothetical protein